MWFSNAEAWGRRGKTGEVSGSWIRKTFIGLIRGLGLYPDIGVEPLKGFKLCIECI